MSKVTTGPMDAVNANIKRGRNVLSDDESEQASAAPHLLPHLLPLNLNLTDLMALCAALF